MNVVRRVLSEKRLAVGAVGIVLLVDVLLFGLAVRPLRAGVTQARTRAAAAAERLAAGADARAAARARQDARERADAELRRFYDEVLPQDLAAARSITYPRLAALAARLGLALERRTSASDGHEGDRLGRLRTNMLLAGEYENIRRFIEALETAPEFLVIEEVVLGQRQEASDSELVLTLGLSTYYVSESGA